MMEAGDLALFRDLLRIRLVEETIATRYHEQEMRCPVHLSVGQEAIAVGVSAVLRRSDKVVSTHRCHAHYLAKGGDLEAMLAEIYGRTTGCCGGRGGSMHLFDDDAGLALSLPIVGSSMPIAAGIALAMRQDGSDNVAVVFVGEGSLEEGAFHETANFAVLHKLPVIFVCENNLFAVYTHIADRQPDRPLTDLAVAHGMVAVQGDGNDVLACRALAAEAVARARAGDGPTLLVLDTYRWREHCGPNYDNDIGYRTEAEFQSWKERCPVDSFRRRLMEAGLLDQGTIAALEAEITAEIAAAFDAARAAPWPQPETAGGLVYAV